MGVSVITSYAELRSKIVNALAVKKKRIGPEYAFFTLISSGLSLSLLSTWVSNRKRRSLCDRAVLPIRYRSVRF